MNQQNAAQYLPLVEALRDGELQIKQLGQGPWLDCTEVEFCHHPEIYRRRPKRKTVPLEMGDLPFPCAIKPGNGETFYVLTEVGPAFVATYGSRYEYEELRHGWLYSPTPNDPTSWKRCEKEVEG